MKKLSILWVVLFSYGISFAQQKAPQEFRSVQNLKIGYLTNKLNFTEEEAQKFWPIYNKYEAELKALRTDVNKEGNVLDNEARLLELKKKYQAEFKRAISDEKINDFYKAEKEFNQYVQKEVMRRRNDPPRKPAPAMRNKQP